MQFKIPQFLDIEDTIFGPFTFKQFIYLAGGGGICFVLYKLLGFGWGFIPMLLVAGFSAALTFYRPNGKPFIQMIESGFGYLFQNKLYIWKRGKVKVTQHPTDSIAKEEKVFQTEETKLSASKLRDLAWSLDILDSEKKNEQH